MNRRYFTCLTCNIVLWLAFHPQIGRTEPIWRLGVGADLSSDIGNLPLNGPQIEYELSTGITTQTGSSWDWTISYLNLQPVSISALDEIRLTTAWFLRRIEFQLLKIPFGIAAGAGSGILVRSSATGLTTSGVFGFRGDFTCFAIRERDWQAGVVLSFRGAPVPGTGYFTDRWMLGLNLVGVKGALENNQAQDLTP